MRFLFLITASFLSLFPKLVLAKASTGVCEPGASTTTDAEAGIFMSGLCRECWKLGDCSLNDMLTVVANTGNFILSIIAGLVFLMYVLGGFFWIASHGETTWVEKGKKYIKNATMGLILVLVAYTGVVALRSIITTGEFSGNYVICSGPETEGQACDPDSKCSGFSCLSSTTTE